MRMKEEHMLNRRLKVAYNIQIAVQNYFIVQAYVSNDGTDYGTLIPVLEKHKNEFEDILEEVTADSGYCSEKGILNIIVLFMRKSPNLKEKLKKRLCKQKSAFKNTV